MNIEIIEENFGPFENTQLIAQVHVKVDGKHMLASTSNAFGHGIETLVFACDETGKVEDWTDIAGSIHNGHVLRKGRIKESLADLLEHWSY